MSVWSMRALMNSRGMAFGESLKFFKALAGENGRGLIWDLLPPSLPDPGSDI
jgi:hypothetical protein